jgi:signal peptidase I
MEPNFNDGDMSLVLERSFSVARFDVIIVGPTFDEKNLIKRVIGLPGEEVVVLPDGEVFIKEPGQIYPHSIQPIQDDSGYIIARSLLILAPSGAICRQLPEGCYWVMGDNRSNSHDSRAFGPVKRDNIIGKVLFKW